MTVHSFEKAIRMFRKSHLNNEFEINETYLRLFNSIKHIDKKIWTFRFSTYEEDQYTFSTYEEDQSNFPRCEVNQSNFLTHYHTIHSLLRTYALCMEYIYGPH